MVPDPNDYSFAESMIRLHSSFKDKCRNALAAIRLTASRRVGFSYIYHTDSSWNMWSSFRFITEDPSPIYKPLKLGKHNIKRDEFYFPLQILYKNKIIDTLEKISKLSGKTSAQEHYSQLSTAIDFYSKSREEYDFGWALLDLVILLESLGYFCKRQLGETGTCDTAGKINHALGRY
jgi:hypothetical protein